MKSVTCLLLALLQFLPNYQALVLPQLKVPSTNTFSPFAPEEDASPSSQQAPIPFLVERIPDHPNESLFADIANVCIDVFFNDGKGGPASAPWKEAQLNYLRNLQTADLKRRRRQKADKNEMFLAYQVQPILDNTDLWTTKPMILQTNLIQNLQSSQQDYVRGDIVGFVEITKRPYGLGANLDVETTTPNNVVWLQAPQERPILTNLAVVPHMRKSGVGSSLLQACEDAVLDTWGDAEIVLEVEDDNTRAQRFYQKRGYHYLFSDRTSRRYNVNGLLLRQERCTRQILRKTLTPTTSAGTQNWGTAALERLRQSIFPTTTTNQP